MALRKTARYLRRARNLWTDLTAFTVFIAWVAGLSLIVDAVTPAPLKPGNLAAMPEWLKLVDAAVLWLFVFIAIRWPLRGGLAAGVLLSLLFLVAGVLQHNLFSVLFWLSLAVAVVTSTVEGIRNGTLEE